MADRYVVTWSRGAAVGALIVFTMVGCGASDRGSVTGTLLWQDGSPLVGARVIASSADTGKSAYGQTDAEGNFALGVSEEGDGIPPGDYTVIVVEDRGDVDNRRSPTIAAKYRNPSSSGLRLSVKTGEAIVFDQTLDSK